MTAAFIPSLPLTAIVAALFLSPSLPAAEGGAWVPLFNGRDFTGWTNVNCAPNTWTMREGLIICTGVPTGVLRTKRQYENFIVELEWKHLRPGGNAGFFVHSGPLPVRGQPFTKAIEIQVLDEAQAGATWTGHGDVFSIQGATFTPDRPHPQGWMRSLPSEKRARPAGEWNHYRVRCENGSVKLEVNGKEVSGGSNCRPRKGYLCLESEGSEVHFRNVRIQELPASEPAPPAEVAEPDEGFYSLYSGIDLNGWRPAESASWRPRDWMLEYEPKGSAHELWTVRAPDNFVFIVDCQNPERGTNAAPTNTAGGPIAAILLRGQTNTIIRFDGKLSVQRSRNQPSIPAVAGADERPGAWNRFIITLRGQQLTVALNDRTMIDRIDLPELPRQGALGIKGFDRKLRFANFYARELQ